MRIARTIAAALLGAALALPAAAAKPAREPISVRFIAINDFHGNLEPTNLLALFLADPAAPPDARAVRVELGGAPALAGMVKALREGQKYSFMLAAGDLVGAAPLPSTLFRHESTIEVLNAMGLELSSLGNHEFDEGSAELLRLAKGGCAPNRPDSPVTSCAQSPYKGARFTYIAANVVDRKGKPLVAPYVIKKFGGVPVAFIGGVTRSTPSLVRPTGVAGLSFLDEADAVNHAAKELRAKGVKAMVAVFHEGIEVGPPQKRGDWNDTRCIDAHGPLLNIARRLAPEIKLVFSGHTHQGYRCEVDGRLLIQGTSFGRGISVVDVKLDPVTKRMLPEMKSINLPVVNERSDKAFVARLADSLPAEYGKVLRDAAPDVEIAEKVAMYASLVKPKAERQVGTITAPFRGSRSDRVDSASGRLIADAQLAATRAQGAQIAFMNPGGIRANLECNGTPPCPVTFGQVFAVQPFGNSLVTMTFTGKQLKEILESQQRVPTVEPTLLQPSEGFTYTWVSDAPYGERVRDMKLLGEPINPEGNYRITVSNFLAEGGDGFTLLKEGRDAIGGGQDVDALIAYLGATTRSPITEARITRTP